ncbi:nucleolar complex-associated protein 3 [Ramaria rubella]|nr:nucleolar complex-associated protein 3 [Ramaria rubella]
MDEICSEIFQLVSKKRKLTSGKAVASNDKGKQRAYERATIPLPAVNDDDENISDQDMEFFTENLATGSFLNHLDRIAIARSKRETSRLHNLDKPARVASNKNDLPSLDSQDEGDWSDGDGVDSSSLQLSDDDGSDYFSPTNQVSQETNFNAEQPYERKARIRGASWEPRDAGIVSKLPIKLPDGRIVDTGKRTILKMGTANGDEAEAGSSNRQVRVPSETYIVEDVSTGARFGRPAIASVIGTSSRKLRIQMAKEQIAGVCQDILADPEGSLGLLRRLHSFSLAQIITPQSPIPNDPFIRRLAMMSQLAILKDVIPGYRIRVLTGAEKAEKVSQMVAKTREWEQGLVSIYQTYLRALESELKGKTEFSELALKSMCTLLTEATHFNFRTNLISAIVMRLSKKYWDNESDLCLQTLITVFREDTTGVPSLEIVRLLNRMVKERKFAVHPSALSCLLHLRLKSELGGIRASETKVDKETSAKTKWESRGKADRKRAKGKKVERPYMSKKAVKALKEKKGIEEQMQEAEAEVDREEKANMHTETLKLLFVLYFRILKSPNWTPLLPAALQGLSRYAHMVNIDFFEDLMQVLKDLIEGTSDETKSMELYSDGGGADTGVKHRLFCIVTAFELLSGQGEALNIDLRDFVNHLYALILPLSVQPHIEATLQWSAGVRQDGSLSQESTADLLFRGLTLAFPVRSAGTSSPVRAAAFAKRILVASLSFPPVTALRSLDFVQGLLVNEPKLQALLATDDRTADGIYRSDVDDPQLANPFGTSFWELAHLAETHWDSRVRSKARQLAQFNGT